MKKIFKAIGIIFALLLVAIICFAIVQRDNLSDFITALYNDSDQIVQKINDNDKALKSELEAHLNESYREYTDEEKAQLENGEISEKGAFGKS